MPRHQSPEDIAANPTSPPTSATSSGSSPTSALRNRQSVEVGAPRATSPVNRNINSRSPQHHHASGSPTTESPASSNALPPAAAVVTSGSRSCTSPGGPAGRVRRQSPKLGTATSRADKNSGPRIILPYHFRRSLSSAKTTTSPKSSIMTSSAAASRPREHHSPVLYDENEEKKSEVGKIKPAVNTWRQSSRHGPRVSIPSLAQSSPSASTFDVKRRRASSGQTMLSEEVLERLHSLVIEGVDRKEDRVLCRDVPWKAFAMCTVTVVVLIAVLVAYFSGRLSSSVQRLAHDSACNSAGCQLLSSEVINRLDRSVDPCDDIEAHVCGPIRWESELVTDTATEMMRVWMQRGALHLESKRRPEVAFSLYNACMAPFEESVIELQAFMSEHGLLWPQYGGVKRHAAYVLLDLLINWGVPYFFELSLRRLPNNKRYSLYINRVKMSKWLRQQHLSDDMGRLKEYANLFYDVYGASDEDRSHIDRMLRLEKDMHHIIEPPDVYDKIQRGTLTELRVSLSSASLFTPSINGETWLQYLNDLLSPHQLMLQDYVLVDDTGLTQTMNELFSRFSNDDLLYTLGWWFAQQFSVIASLDGSVASYGSSAKAAANRPSDCYSLAESRYRRQLFLERAHTSLGTGGMRQVEVLLNNIRNTTLTLLSSISWMDEQTRKEATAIVEATEFEAWKPHIGDNHHGEHHQEKLVARSAGDGEHSVWKEWQVSGSDANDTERDGNRTGDARLALPVPPLPRTGERKQGRTSSYTTVVQGWVDSATSYKRQFPNWPLDDSLLHRHLSYATLVHYDYWWNSAFLQMAAFAEPLFYLDGPPSANYGGLGALVARHLFKAYDYMVSPVKRLTFSLVFCCLAGCSVALGCREISGSLAYILNRQ
ncbi:hypothetical protein HPB49_015068 [Dermacentor silvarum]|uniref:Uncharacterized protein n=1 Tax=Dermacentor silvarum TaxID=543639 RepID=A0ACB8CRL8_DERSI|nr:hypothetical protein HPB49_015068 [Dermacentor silvarum]